MALLNLNFESQYLQNNTEVSIILPERPRDVDSKIFYGSEEKYKVLWLLHGTYGDHSDWLRKTSVELYAVESNLIVVSPSALNSDYMNWNGFGAGFRMWDFITEELMPIVYNWFPASDRREDNFIAGLSMGAFGATALGVAHPDKFAALAALSGAPFNYEKIRDGAEIGIAGLGERMKNQVANAGGWDAYLASPSNTWKTITENHKGGKLPCMYFAMGTKDFLWDSYLDFKNHAAENDIGATFEEFVGFEHEWRFWDLTIQRALDFFGITDPSKHGNAF